MFELAKNYFCHVKARVHTALHVFLAPYLGALIWNQTLIITIVFKVLVMKLRFKDIYDSQGTSNWWTFRTLSQCLII